MATNLEKRQEEYNNKYGMIPTDYNERLMYMCDKYNISYEEMISIFQERNRRMCNLYYTMLKVVLYQIPQGAKRPRYRICRKNLVSSAISNPDFIHVYSPDAAANHNYMRRIVNQQEIIQLEHLICTPCDVHYRAFFPTPKSYNKIETFMAEIGLDRPLVKPDFDNIEKLYADMYNSNVWLDDALTIDGTVGKYYSILPRVEIDLCYLNAVYCKQQYINITSRKDYDPSMGLTYV
jgi:Holliday junction resolvase RusA-like endonuclease